MKKIFVLMLIATFTQTAQTAVVKKRDSEQNCTLFKVISADTNGQLKISEDEVIINQKDAYGISLTDMEIDFSNREVRVQPQINVILGMNRPLLDRKAVISAENTEFNFLINQLNRKIFLFEQICISDKNEIEYAKMFETPTSEKQKHK
jgi:hypothetical protein